jgi:hypothetical protein
METCLMVVLVLVVLIWIAYELEQKARELFVSTLSKEKGEGWEMAAQKAGALARCEHRLEMCRKDLKRTIRERASARGRVTKLKKRVAELEGPSGIRSADSTGQGGAE